MRDGLRRTGFSAASARKQLANMSQFVYDIVSGAKSAFQQWPWHWPRTFAMALNVARQKVYSTRVVDSDSGDSGMLASLMSRLDSRPPKASLRVLRFASSVAICVVTM